jgi:hypothetical protein
MENKNRFINGFFNKQIEAVIERLKGGLTQIELEGNES